VEAPARHLREWSDLLSGSFTRFTFEAPDPAGFRGWMGVRTIAGIDFIEMHTGEHVARREVGGTESGERADYLVCLQVAGTGEFIQDGRTAALRPGDITVFDTTRPTTVVSSGGYRNLCMKFPQRALGVASARMDELTATRFPAGDGLAPAARGVLSTLVAVADSLTGRGRFLAAHSALQVMATLFESSLGDADHAPGRSRRALFERMTDYLRRHLDDPALSPSTLAAAHFVSLRQAHAIFADTGSSIASTIRTMRLQRARRELADPALRDLPVAAIGMRCGFPAASGFGRAFRDAYGISPARYRDAAMPGA
jgi:AraC-like DNA-binding protein